MRRIGITGIRMVVAIQFFTTALVLFTGVFAIEVGSIHLNRVAGAEVFYTYTKQLREVAHLAVRPHHVPTLPIHIPVYQIKEALYRMRVVVLCGGIIAFSAGLILSHAIRRPIKRLMEGVQSVEAGNFRTLVRIPGQDEFAPLVRAFNAMVDALNRSQEHLRKVFFAAYDAILSTDLGGRLDLWAGGCQRLFGFTAEEVRGRSLEELLAPGGPPGILSSVMETARESGRWEGELQFRSKDGRVFHGWCVATNLRDEDGRVTGYLHVIRDMTEKKRLEMQLIQSEKMASVGELAAGVAHEINNPLSGILSNAEFLQEEIPDEEVERHEEIREIIRNSERIRVIVRNLLNFSRQKDAEGFGPVSIPDVIESSLTLTRHQMELDNIKIIQDVPRELPLIQGNANKIEQVFINVLSNARYALNEKYPGDHEDKILEIRAYPCGRGVERRLRLEFTDHGTGIPKEIMDRVIDPFFTTKEQGKGTGLGMSISYNILKEHGGELRLESEEGSFTRVILELPVKEEEEDAGGGDS